MVFGQLVDSVPIFGSQRRSYILIGAAFTAGGLLTLAGAAGGWIAFKRADQLYILGAIADRDRHRDPGRGRGRDVDRSRVPRRRRRAMRGRSTRSSAELGMVQVLGRLALSALASSRWRGCPAGSPGFSRARRCSCSDSSSRRSRDCGALLIRSESTERRPIDWRILGGGIAFGAVVLAVALGDVPFAQEAIFVLSMAVICTMLVLRHARTRPEHAARDPVHQHHHLRVPRHAIGRRRLFLVDARRAQVRRGLLRQPAPDRRDHRHRGDVGLQQATDRIFRDQGAVLARGRRAPSFRCPISGCSSACTIGPSNVRLRRPRRSR